MLELKYSDRFNYLMDNTFYSERLEQGITCVRAYGDDYQAKLYEEDIVRNVKLLFPEGSRFGAIRVASVQTKTLFDSWSSYYGLVAPTVYVQVSVPETYGKWEFSRLPSNIIVEGLL